MLAGLAPKLWHLSNVAVQVSVSAADVFVTTLVNPKVLVFATMMPPWSARADAFGHLGAFAAVGVTVACGWLSVGRAFAGGGRAAVMRRVAAVVLAGFSVLVGAAAWSEHR